MAELASLPQSGISEMEASVPYASSYASFSTEIEQEQSSLYFLACVSIRRLLNRVHDLLWAPDTGVAADETLFPSIVAEFDHQLDQWRRCLPAAFHFAIEQRSPLSTAAGFLRQRYLTCRAVIYRPYLNLLLARSSSGCAVSEDLIANTKTCLDLCVLYSQDAESFPHTLLVDGWIASLSWAVPIKISLSRDIFTDIEQARKHLVDPTGRQHGP